MLDVAVMNDWDLQQMDVSNIFLHNPLTEIIYMMQPPSFKNTSKPNYVSQLRKSIYVLKQAPWAWYTALKNALLHIGFLNFKANSSSFILRDANITCYFLVYVNNLVIIGNDKSFIASIITKLGN